MADSRAGEIILASTPRGAARLAALLACFLATVGNGPDLEELSTLWLLGWLLSAGAFSLILLGGAAWVFDVAHRTAARHRADQLCSWAAVALAVLGVSTSNAAGGASPGALLGMAGAWLCWCDWPWEAVDFLLSKFHRAPGVRNFALSGGPMPDRPSKKIPAAMPPGAEATLIASGKFEVDRGRILEKLSRFQLESAEDFLLPWLRLAVASGAERIDLNRDGPAIELSFDGRPLAPAWTADPYSSLFEEEDPDAARHRHLAYGLLALLRLGPRGVSAWSGEGEARARLRVEVDGQYKEPGPEPAGPKTVIRLRLGFFAGRLAAARAILRARDEFGMARAKLFIGGKEAPPEWTLYGRKAVHFENGSTRGVILPPLSGQKDKVLNFHFLGVLALRVHETTAGAPFLAWVSDDSLSLDLSQSSVVDNLAFRNAVLAVRVEGGKLGYPRELSRAPDHFSFSPAGLLAVLGGAVGAWGGLMWALEFRPELAFPALAVYATVTAGMLVLVAVWVAERLMVKPGPPRQDRRGFVHHELMIVVAITGILAAIAIPKFAELIRKSSEGATKRNLGSLRSGLSVFYKDSYGRFPLHPISLAFANKYLGNGELPKAKTPNYHPDSAKIRLGMDLLDADDAGGWLYIADSHSKDFGSVYVNCTHTDSKGSVWTSY